MTTRRLGFLLVMIAGVALSVASPARVRADGLLVGCPDAQQEPAGDADLAQGADFALEVTTQMDGENPKSTSYSLAEATAALAAPQDPILDPLVPDSVVPTRDLDADGDGLKDLRWNFAVDEAAGSTNFGPLWKRLGSSLPAVLDPQFATRPWVALKVELDRLATDPLLGPVPGAGLKATVSLYADLKTPSPQELIVETVSATVGYDTRTPAATPPETFDGTVLWQDKPQSAPNHGFLGARHAETYTIGGVPGGPAVVPGTEPPITVVAQVGQPSDPGGDLDVALAWTKAPAAFAFARAAACDIPEPEVTLAWDYRLEAIGAVPLVLPTADAFVDVTSGKGKGLDGYPSLHVQAQVTSVPLELTADLTRQTATITHSKHADANQDVQPSDVDPDLVVDELLITAEPKEPGDSETRIRANAVIEDLPRITNIDLVTDKPTGDFLEADVRFCEGAEWGDATCAAENYAATKLGLVVTDILPDEPDPLPALPSGGDWFAAYTSRVEPVDPKLAHFRYGGLLPGVKHLHVTVPPGGSVKGAHIDVEMLGQTPKGARVFIDVDSRTTNAWTQKLEGSKLAFDGSVTPLPHHVNVGYESSQPVPVTLSYDAYKEHPVLAGEFWFDGDDDSGLLKAQGRAQMGDATEGAPEKASLVYTRPAQPGGVNEVDYKASGPSPVKIGLVASRKADRDTGRRVRVWADGVVGGRLVAQWQKNADGLKYLALAPCDSPKACPVASPVIEALSARAVYGTPQPLEQLSLLDAPQMPSIDHPDVYPAFSETPYGVTSISRLDGVWGADARVGKLASLVYQNTGVTKGQTVCVATENLDPAVTDTRFGTRLFLNAPPRQRRVGAGPWKESPVLLDGILDELPNVLDLRINDYGAIKSDKPWLWVDTTSCGKDAVPKRRDPVQVGGMAYRMLAMSGDREAQRNMLEDPLGKPSIALQVPADDQAPGVRVHALADGTNDTSGLQVSGRVFIPDLAVISRPNVQSCNEDTAPNFIMMCQTKHLWERDEIASARVKAVTTLNDIGTFDALVRVRERLRDDDLGDDVCPLPQPPDPADGRKVCDTDIVASLAHLPGKFEIEGTLRTNNRVPDAFVSLQLKSLATNPFVPNWESGDLTVTEDASPARAGGWSSAPTEMVPNARLTLTNVGPKLEAQVRVQGIEKLPESQGQCPNHGWSGRGTTQLAYAHTRIVVLKAKLVQVFARSDSLGRLQTQILSDAPVTGDVRVKIANIGVCETREQTETIDQLDPAIPPLTLVVANIDLFVDMDLPFKVNFYDTTDARLSMDKTMFLTYLPKWNSGDPSDKSRMAISFGEQLTDGTWLPGANWVKRDNHFDEVGGGDWNAEFTGGHAVDILHDRTSDPAFYVKSVENSISTEFDPSWCCLTGDWKGKYFLIDLFWDKDIRDDMYCRDAMGKVCTDYQVPDPNLPILDTTPGRDFFSAVVDMGHLVLDDPIAFGELETLSDVPSMTGTIPGSPYWSNSVDEESVDPEIAKWLFHTAPVLKALDGTTYEIWLGVADLEKAKDDPEQSDTEITLLARYAGGVGRWQRRLNVNTAPCGVWLSCKVEGTMELLPSGHLLLNYTLFSAQAEWQEEGGGYFMFDPSGIGGPPSAAESCGVGAAATCVADVQAVAGTMATLDQVVTNDPKANGAIASKQLRKVWYFGDGDILDSEDPSVGPAEPAEHVYPFAGVYPAILMYYSFDDARHEWVPIISIAQQVTVS